MDDPLEKMKNYTNLKDCYMRSNLPIENFHRRILENYKDYPYVCVQESYRFLLKYRDELLDAMSTNNPLGKSCISIINDLIFVHVCIMNYDKTFK